MQLGDQPRTSAVLAAANADLGTVLAVPDGMTAQGDPLVVVVTGASSGIGRAIVRELAAQHARIGLVALWRLR